MEMLLAQQPSQSHISRSSVVSVPKNHPTNNTPPKSNIKSPSETPITTKLKIHNNEEERQPLPVVGSKKHGRRIQTLLFLDIMGVDINKLLGKNPLLKYIPVENIYTIVAFLQERGVKPSEYARIFSICPEMLLCNVENEMKPAMKFLLEEAKLPAKKLPKALKKWPKLLTVGVNDRLRPSFRFLKNDMGFSQDMLRVCSNLVLFTLSVEEQMIPKLDFLQNLGISYKECVRFVLRAPGTFTYSVEKNMQPKYDFLVKEIGGDVEDLVDFPQYFSFSLEKRIKPRHKLVLLHNKCLSLHEMLRTDDREFFKILHGDGGG